MCPCLYKHRHNTQQVCDVVLYIFANVGQIKCPQRRVDKSCLGRDQLCNVYNTKLESKYIPISIDLHKYSFCIFMKITIKILINENCIFLIYSTNYYKYKIRIKLGVKDYLKKQGKNKIHIFKRCT